MLAWIVGFSLLGSIGAIGLAGLFMVFPLKTRKVLIPCLISYATGTLLGAAFLGLIPESLAQLPAAVTLGAVLSGIVLFFVLEKLVIWRHCHKQQCEVHSAAASLILVGDAFHNLVDGAVIAAAFATSLPLGIATSLAVAAHELPQEVGDFAILLDGGYPRGRALLLNSLSALATFPGAILAYVSLVAFQGAIPYITALSAASFIYIAIADLVPGLHRYVGLKSSLWQLALLVAGIGTILVFHLGR